MSSYLQDYMIRPDALKTMPPGITPDNPYLLDFLFKNHPTSLIRKDEFQQKIQKQT